MLPDLVSKDELIRILNGRLKNLPHGKGAIVRDVIRLRHADGAECNWMPDFATTNSTIALLDVFAKARLEFILMEEGQG